LSYIPEEYGQLMLLIDPGPTYGSNPCKNKGIPATCFPE
jgi:hypothetical protein